MPIPGKYVRDRVEQHRVAERRARRDTVRAWLRASGEVALWTCLGLFLIGLAFHTFDVQLGLVWWWLGFIVWVGGVTLAALSAYRRGQNRGDW